jgi:hypothetical protein
MNVFLSKIKTAYGEFIAYKYGTYRELTGNLQGTYREHAL